MSAQSSALAPARNTTFGRQARGPRTLASWRSPSPAPSCWRRRGGAQRGVDGTADRERWHRASRAGHLGHRAIARVRVVDGGRGCRNVGSRHPAADHHGRVRGHRSRRARPGRELGDGAGDRVPGTCRARADARGCCGRRSQRPGSVRQLTHGAGDRVPGRCRGCGTNDPDHQSQRLRPSVARPLKTRPRGRPRSPGHRRQPGRRCPDGGLHRSFDR